MPPTPRAGRRRRRTSKWKAFKDGVPIQGFDFYQEIIAKAREVEEAKGDK